MPLMPDITPYKTSFRHLGICHFTSISNYVGHKNRARPTWLDIDPESLELLETESQRIVDHRANPDGWVRDTVTGDYYLLHIEIQNDNDIKMPLRIMRYYTDIRLSWPDEPIRQYLIYIGKQRLTMPDGIGNPELRYQ